MFVIINRIFFPGKLWILIRIIFFPKEKRGHKFEEEFDQWLQKCHQEHDKQICFMDKMGATQNRKSSTLLTDSGSCNAEWTPFERIRWGEREFRVTQMVHSSALPFRASCLIRTLSILHVQLSTVQLCLYLLFRCAWKTKEFSVRSKAFGFWGNILVIHTELGEKLISLR